MRNQAATASKKYRRGNIKGRGTKPKLFDSQSPGQMETGDDGGNCRREQRGARGADANRGAWRSAYLAKCHAASAAASAASAIASAIKI